jgi:hypothetical protein
MRETWLRKARLLMDYAEQLEARGQVADAASVRAIAARCRRAADQ